MITEAGADIWGHEMTLKMESSQGRAIRHKNLNPCELRKKQTNKQKTYHVSSELPAFGQYHEKQITSYHI